MSRPMKEHLWRGPCRGSLFTKARPTLPGLLVKLPVRKRRRVETALARVTGEFVCTNLSLGGNLRQGPGHCWLGCTLSGAFKRHELEQRFADRTSDWGARITTCFFFDSRSGSFAIPSVIKAAST